MSTADKPRPVEGIVGHSFYKCARQNCYPCQFCDGGLGWCTVCNGFEGTLTTECCGRKITPEEEHAIYKTGTLDFKAGEWQDVKHNAK